MAWKRASDRTSFENVGGGLTALLSSSRCFYRCLPRTQLNGAAPTVDLVLDECIVQLPIFVGQDVGAKKGGVS
jgi:hypothetical protein